MDNNIGIAIIAEGITDQVVIEKILKVHYKSVLSDDELSIKHLQPHRDETDEGKQAKDAHGGWKNVLEYLKQDEILIGALSLNEKIVVQIDGDICFDDSINIDPNLDCDTVCEEIIKLLKKQIDSEILEHIEDRLLFAIPLHSTECWLISLHSNDVRYRGKKNKCIENLAIVTADAGLDCTKNHDNYEVLVRPIRKSKNLDDIGTVSRSFQKFRESLPKIQRTDAGLVIN